MMMENNICVVSDLHLGCHCDSEHWHEITLTWGRWLKKELEYHNIDNIIMCGDFFDNRTEIGVKTISVAGELMDILREFDITMITGNHDLFYKNRNDVNSISIFEGRTNITIINDLTIDKIGDKQIMYIPWGSDISKAPNADIIFGHLEINGFKMMPGRIAEGVTPPTDLTALAPLVFSGHFHLREARKYKNSEIIYVGSPYQINWGEATNNPGYYIVDIDKSSYTFHENIISPRHIKMSTKHLKLNKISGNIIKVEIDATIGEDKIEEIKSKVFSTNPLEVQFDILRTEPTLEGTVVYSDTVDITKVMLDFVDKLEVAEFKKEVKDKLIELYKKYNK